MTNQEDNQFSWSGLPLLGKILIICSGVAALGYFLIPRSSELSNIPLEPYSEFISKVERGDISRVKIGNQVIYYQLKNPLESLPIPGNPPVNPPESSHPFYC
ncbi:MAG: cell division protein FtsH, partial [Microcystis sp.]